MIYVVEIEGPQGGKATKEYEASSVRAALVAAERELRNYPGCQVFDIRAKWNRREAAPVSRDAW
jgi:hypothetical protein